MRALLSSGTIVETIVTLAAAGLMTFAGFAMVAGTQEGPMLYSLADLIHPKAGAPREPAKPLPAKVAMPHVDRTLV